MPEYELEMEIQSYHNYLREVVDILTTKIKTVDVIVVQLNSSMDVDGIPYSIVLTLRDMQNAFGKQIWNKIVINIG